MVCHVIELDPSEHRLECAEGETLLHAALRAGIGFPYECNSGSCGTCMFEPLSGEFHSLWAEAPGLSERSRSRGRMLACQSEPRRASKIRVRLDDRYCPPVAPKRFPARLIRAEKLTRDMTEFTFASEGEARFVAGQYVLLRLPSIAGGRAYSMSNLPNSEGKWQLIIKHKPNGAMTDYLFGRLALGDEVELAGPYGLAYLDNAVTADLVCIAGGSGFSPMLSIVRQALAMSVPERQILLFYGGRTFDDMIDPARFGLAGALGSRLHFHFAVSEAVAAEAWSGERGFIHEVAERLAAPMLNDSEIFLAGPPMMIRANLEMLDRQGVARSRIHYDNFF